MVIKDESEPLDRREVYFIGGLNATDPVRILVIRPDRIGDVILSTPVFEIIKQNYPHSHLTVMVRENLLPLLQGLSAIDQLMIFDPEGKHAGFKGFFRLFNEMRRGRFRIAVALQTHWKIAFAVFCAHVRHRVGPWSKFYSYLFYNRGMIQHRSNVEMHEADYNLQLLRKIGIRAISREIQTQVAISDSVKQQALDWLKENKWRSAEPLLIVHPGMGGSALNWPEQHYVDLLVALLDEGKQILVTGGASEKQLIDNIKHGLGSRADKIFFFLAEPSVGVDFLGALFLQAQVVIAPSTGPLHLAVAVGKRVVTFYSPIRVQSAIRWGPYLEDETKASILVPEVYCGQDQKCLGNLCNYFLCMKSITIKQVLRQIHFQLDQAAAENQRLG